MSQRNILAKKNIHQPQNLSINSKVSSEIMKIQVIQIEQQEELRYRQIKHEKYKLERKTNRISGETTGRRHYGEKPEKRSHRN